MEDLWIFGVTRSIRSTVSGIQRNLFGTGMEDHHNVADLFQMVRTHGKWGCGNMVLPGAAEFCTVLFTVIFTNNGVHGEKLQLFCLQ